MPSRLLSPCELLLLALTLLALTGCAQTPSAGPEPTARWPKPAPLPAAILQIDTRPSTATLSKGREWSQNLELLLTGETPK